MLRLTSVKIASVAAVAMISACTIPDPEYMAKLPGPTPVKEPRAEAVEFTHDVAFKPVNARFEPEERRQLDTFLGDIRAGESDRFVIIAANGVDGGIANQRGEMVEAYLRAKGVHHLVRAPHVAAGTDGAPPRDTVRVLVKRYVVELPPCPDWTKFPGANFANTVHSNFGCATAINLGLMVADPADLKSGRGLGPADGEYSAAAIERYRMGKTKPIHGQLSTGDESSGSTSQDSGAN